MGREYRKWKHPLAGSAEHAQITKALKNDLDWRTMCVADSAVEEALCTALRDDIPRPLAEIATQLGYRSVAPLQNRYRDLCGQIVSKRRFGLKSFPLHPARLCHESASSKRCQKR